MKKGYVTIMIVLVLLALTGGAIATVSFLSNSSLEQVQSIIWGEQSFYSAESCLEEGLWQFKKDQTYTGGKTVFPEGSCDIEVDSREGNYTLNAYFSGQNNFHRSVSAEVNFAEGKLSVVHWGEKHLVIQ